MSSAYLLVSHGSRDPRPEIAMEQLANLISQPQQRVEAAEWTKNSRLRNTLKSSAGLAPSLVGELLIGTAYLELSAEPLHKQIKQFGDRALTAGYNRIQIVPLFLLPGVHVMEDIPTEVAIAQQALGQEVKIDLRPYLGTHPGLIRLLATQMAAIEVDTWILLAHGSRRAGSKQTIEAIATQLGAVSAYWAVSPKLESRLETLVNAGYQKIGILPYFLFAGGITDAIAQAVDQLKAQYTSVNLVVAKPIGASAELADLIWDLIEK